MASSAEAKIGRVPADAKTSLAPDGYEKLLGLLAIVLLGCVAVAVFKGWPNLLRLEWTVIFHLGTMSLALALTPIMLWRRRGDGLHRQLGWLWSVAMLTTAIVSFSIRDANNGGFSLIHILSVVVLVMVPMLVWQARTHRVARHRRTVRGLVTGALLIAGFFTFPFNRLLGQWLFG